MVKRRQVKHAAGGECFYICAIGSDGSDERKRADDVFDFVVSPTAKACNLKPVRADKIDESGDITRQIVDHFIAAEVVIADFWGTNPNVFYELAIRHAVKKPVIHLYIEKIPFDVQQMRAIKLDHRDLRSAQEAQKQILEQMKAALEPDFEQWTPFTIAINLEKLQAGESNMEQAIAEIYAMVESIRRPYEIQTYETIKVVEPSTIEVGPPEGLVQLSNLALGGSKLAPGIVISEEPEPPQKSDTRRKKTAK